MDSDGFYGDTFSRGFGDFSVHKRARAWRPSSGGKRAMLERRPDDLMVQEVRQTEEQS